MKFNPVDMEFERIPESFLYDTLVATRKISQSGCVIDALLYFRKDAKKLVILLPSAQPAHSQVINPVFHRWSWFSQINDASFICLSDPTLYYSNTKCGWFQGDGKVDCIGEFNFFINELIDATKDSFDTTLTYGSSMGGFGALMLAARMNKAVALAEVPQLDLRKYPHKGAISDLEALVLKDNFTNYSENNLGKVSVLEAFKNECKIPPFTILTNMADSEYENHVGFLSEVKNALPQCNTVGKFQLIVHDDSQGHKPLETGIAIEYLKSCLNSGFNSKSVSTGGKAKNKIESYKEIIELAVAECAKVRFVRDEVDTKNYVSAINLLKQAANIDKSADWPYLKICSMTKLWTNSFNKDILDSALAALSRKQGLEGFLYACRGILANYEPMIAKGKVINLMATCTSEQIANSGNIFLAICAYDSGDYASYAEHLKEFKEKKALDFDFYLSIPVSTCYLEKWVKDCEYGPGDVKIASVKMNLSEFSNDSAKYIVSASCDQGYFDKYAEYIVKSFSHHCSSDAVMHLSLVNANASHIEKKLHEWGAKSIVFSIHHFDTQINTPPIASLTRFSHVYQLLSYKKIPVIVLDLDCVIKKSLLGLVEEFSDCDVGSRILGAGVAPWEKYTGGFALFNPTENSLTVSRNMAFAAERVSNLNAKQWWIDQNCFEAGIRSTLSFNDFKLKNMYSVRDQYCVMPVGNGDAKKHFLDKALSEYVG